MKISDIVSHSGLSGYAQAGLILFVFAFVLVVARLYWPGRRQEMERASRLPLDDGERNAHGDN